MQALLPQIGCCEQEELGESTRKLAVRRTIVLKSAPMWRLPIGWFLGLALLTAIPVAAQDPSSKQNEEAVNPEAIQGCYELTLSPWFPEMKLGEDEDIITPPRRIQLLAEKDADSPDSKGYAVRPAPGVKPSVHSGMYWLPKGSKSIEITFTTGFSGVALALKTADAETLHGKATTFWDFKRKKQIAEVMARRVPCGKQ
jgi:hypothetical protein